MESMVSFKILEELPNNYINTQIDICENIEFKDIKTSVLIVDKKELKFDLFLEFTKELYMRCRNLCSDGHTLYSYYKLIK